LRSFFRFFNTDCIIKAFYSGKTGSRYTAKYIIDFYLLRTVRRDATNPRF